MLTCSREGVLRVKDTAVALAWLQVGAVDSHHARNVVALLIKERHRSLLILSLAHLALEVAHALLDRHILARPVSVAVEVD